MAAEHQRHTIALREALNLRRARNDHEAQTRLLNERVRHAVAARDLARRIRPSSGGLLRRWASQAWLDIYVERVRREVGAVRVPGQTQPLTRESALRRIVVWAQGGPRVGYASDLVEYHRSQRAHYRLAKVSATRLARNGRHDEAMTQFWNEQDFHMRSAHDLGEMFGAESRPGPSPLATRPLAPMAGPTVPPASAPLHAPVPEPVAP